MNKAIQAAQRAARKAHESIYYNGVMTVSEYQQYTDPDTHRTTMQWVVVLENQPCNLSFEKITTAVQTEAAATISQAVKVFVSPDVVIKPLPQRFLKPKSKNGYKILFHKQEALR